MAQPGIARDSPQHTNVAIDGYREKKLSRLLSLPSAKIVLAHSCKAVWAWQERSQSRIYLLVDLRVSKANVCGVSFSCSSANNAREMKKEDTVMLL